MNRRLLRTGLISVALIGTGCTGGGQRFDEFFYRFTNVIADILAADFYVDDVLTEAALSYLGSADYREVENEEAVVFFDVAEAGTSNVLDSVVVNKSDEASFHLYAVGMAFPGSQQPGTRLVPIQIQRTTPPGSNARLIFVHGYVRAVGTATPNVDIIRTGRISPEIADLPFGESRVSILAAGTYDIEVRIAGTQQGTLFTVPNVTIQAGKIYSVILKGVEGQTGAMEPGLILVEEPTRDD